MASTFNSEGRTINFTAAADITGGSVVIVGDSIVVAAHDVLTGQTGVGYLEGEFSLPKVSGAEIANGEQVIWDSSSGAFEDSAATPASGDVSGAAFATTSAGSGLTSVKVKLSNPGTVA